MSKITRQQMIGIAEFLEKHPELVNFIRRSSDYTLSQETALWEELAAALGKSQIKPWTKDWIKTWWNDYAYELNRAYMNVLTNPAETKLPAPYEVDLACRFLTVMGYDNVHRKLLVVKEEIHPSSDKEEKPHQQDPDLDIKITSTIKTVDSLPDQTSATSQVAITPAQPETKSVALKSTPKALNRCTRSRNATSSVSRRCALYFRPIAPKILKSLPTPTSIAPKISESPSCSTTIEQERFKSLPTLTPVSPKISESSPPPCITPLKQERSESMSNLVPITPKILKSLPTSTPICLKISVSTPCSTAIEQERFESPSNLAPIQLGTPENLTPTVLERSECPPDAAAVEQNVSESPQYTAPIKQKRCKSPPKSSSIATLSSKNAPCSISENSQDGTSSPNNSIDEALLAIAKEAKLENSLSKRNMELKQKLLRLNKRKITAVDIISKKLCLF